MEELGILIDPPFSGAQQSDHILDHDVVFKVKIY